MVGEVLARYADDKGKGIAAPATLAYSIAALAPFWGDVTCDAVKGSTSWRYERERQRAPGTVRRELGVLQAALNHAHAEGLLVHPVKVTLPKAGEPRDRWLTRSEAARLLRSAAPHVRRFILISLYTGRRASAVLDLTWTRVDLDAGAIRFKAEGAIETNKRRGRVRIRGHVRQCGGDSGVALRGHRSGSLC
jgi:integrase